MSVAERLKIYINHLKMSNTAFERSIGASNGYINSIRKSIGLDKVKQIEQYYPNLNMDWLLEGDGDMLKANTPLAMEQLKAYGIDDKPQAVVSEGNSPDYYLSRSGIRHYKMPNGTYQMVVPYVPVEAYNTYIVHGEEEDVSSKLDQYGFIVPQIGQGKYMAFEIKGDSMDDDTRGSLCEGDIVLGRELNRDLWANKLHIDEYPNWIIVLNNMILCKQIIDQDLKKRTIVCHSLNPSPQYSNFELRMEDIRQMFNIVQRVSNMR